jgi:hypothetical protein
MSRKATPYADLSFGGVLGFGNKWFAVLWDALKYSRHDGKFILNVDRDVLDTAPGFAKTTGLTSRTENLLRWSSCSTIAGHTWEIPSK